MSRFFSHKYDNLTPYTPGEQPKGQTFIKLNTNENPFPPTYNTVKLAEEQAGKLELYSDPECTELVKEASSWYGIDKEEIIFTNGSDEVLNFAFMAFCDENHPAVFPDITYGFYPVYAKLKHIPYEEIPLKEDFSLDINDYLGIHKTIFIANPNAPTSRAIAVEDCARIAKANPDSVVIVDEAYVAFENEYESAVSLINEYKNVCVVRTLSKAFSLAGIRLGYAVGSEELIEGLRRARDSFNSYPVDRLAQKVAEAALLDKDYYNETRSKIIATRTWFEKELKELGFTMPPSSANFVYAKPPVDCGTLYQNLRTKGILV